METSDILTKAARRDGMTVPKDYFADFNARMAASLPPTDFERGASEHNNVLPRTWWQCVRPYAYMAAMFAGVWCMMKMADMTHPSASLSIDQHPDMVTAVNNDNFFNNYVVPTVDESQLYDDLYEDGFDTADFEMTDTPPQPEEL